MSSTTKFAPFFPAGEDQYLYIDNLGFGEESVVQRVLHVQTGEARVRKISRHLFSPTAPVFNADIETRALRLIQETAERKRTPQLPNIMQLYSTHAILVKDIPAPAYARASYLELYNGGDLGEFRNLCRQRSLSVPAELVLRLVLQVCRALQFMYASCYPSVIHGDLHRGNIFLHWTKDRLMPDFFIGDLGLAKFRYTKPPRYEDNTGMIPPERFLSFSQTWDRADIVSLLNLCGLFPIVPWAPPCHKSANLLVKVIAHLEAISCEESTPTWPHDLSKVIALASSAEASTDEDRAKLELIRDVFRDKASALPLQPPYYDSIKEAVADFKELHGPFHLAKVSLGAGFPGILEVSDETYHFPAEGDE